VKEFVITTKLNESQVYVYKIKADHFIITTEGATFYNSGDNYPVAFFSKDKLIAISEENITSKGSL
jgi:hypothetical protein